MSLFSFFTSLFKSAAAPEMEPSTKDVRVDQALAKILQDTTRILGETTLGDMLACSNLDNEIEKIDGKANALYFAKNDPGALENSSALKKVVILLRTVQDLMMYGPGCQTKFQLMRGYAVIKVTEGASPGTPVFTDGFGNNLHKQALGKIIGFCGVDHTPQERYLSKPPGL